MSDSDFEIETDVETAVSNDIDFDTDISFEKDVSTNVGVFSDVEVDGNLSTLTVDAEAIGSNTLVEVDSSVLSVENELSSVSLSIVSAAGNEQAVNRPPVASPDSFFVEYGDTVLVNVAGNDADPDGAINPASLAVGPAMPTLGSAAIVGGQLQYAANAIVYDTTDDSAADPFQYMIADNQGATSVGSVTANVIDPMRETDTDSASTANGQTLQLMLSTEDRTYNNSSFVEVELRASDLGEQDINVSFVLDGSGSISFSQYAEQLEAVQNTINSLRADFAGANADIDVQLVQFSSGAQQATFDLFDPALDNIAALPVLSQLNGSTNYEAGLQLALNFFNAQAPGEDDFVFFASDGAPNTPSFTAHLDEAAALKATASITAVGFGFADLSVLNGIDNTGGAQLVPNAESLGDAFATSPLFAADLIDFSLTVSQNGGPAVEGAPEADLTSLGGGNFALNDLLLGLGHNLGDMAVVTATAVYDVDGDLATTNDRTTLIGSTTINGTDGSDIVFA